jgi:hypothetical protein
MPATLAQPDYKNPENKSVLPVGAGRFTIYFKRAIKP